MSPRTLASLCALLAATSLPACSAGEEACHDQLDELVESIGHLPHDQEGLTDHGPTGAGGSCPVHSYTRIQNVQDFIGVFDENQHIWPGSVLHGASVVTGDFQPVLIDLGKITFSVSLENLNDQVAATMTDPSLSVYRQTIRDILGAGVTGGTPANIEAKITRVNTESDAYFAVGGGVGFAGFGVHAAFDWSRTDIKHRYVVRYLQRYYTIDVDPPRDPSDFLAPRVCTEDLDDELGPEDPPVYVSRIVYGRMVLLTFESSENTTQTDFEAAINASLGLVTVDASTASRYKNMVDSSSITAFVYGGSGGDGAQGTTNYDGIIQYINNGGNYSKDSPGAPLEFQLSYLSDATPVTVSLHDDYDAPSCSDTGRLRVRLRNFTMTDGGNEGQRQVYGSVKATYAGQTQTLWSADGGHAVRLLPGIAWPSDDDGESIGDVTFDVSPDKGHEVHLEAHLKDVDDCLFCGDDDLGTAAKDVDLGEGWSQDVLLRPTGDGATTEVNLAFEPA